MQAQPSVNQPPNQGVVTKKTTGSYTVYIQDRPITCTLGARLHKTRDAGPRLQPSSRKGRSRPGMTGRNRSDPSASDPIASDPIASDPIAGSSIAIGDMVRIVPGPEGSGQIVEVLPRRNKVARRTAVPMPSAHPFEQVIAANVDQVVPVFAAADPAPKWGLLDRYLVSAESSEIPALICITKLDLALSKSGTPDRSLQEAVEEYRTIGYPVILASAVTGEGLSELRAALQGRISVLLGKSGVGKSTLLNALQPDLGLRVNAVSQVTGKGKHTTTHLEMFPLEFGGAVVDTPGVREFGLWEVNEADLALFFPEMRPFIGKCRFGMDCQHDEEPGCAVRKAVVAGQISPRRYQSFMRLKVDA